MREAWCEGDAGDSGFDAIGCGLGPTGARRLGRGTKRAHLDLRRPSPEQHNAPVEFLVHQRPAGQGGPDTSTSRNPANRAGDVLRIPVRDDGQLGPRKQQRDVVGLGRPAIVVDLRVAADDAVQRRERAEEAAHLPHGPRQARDGVRRRPERPRLACHAEDVGEDRVNRATRRTSVVASSGAAQLRRRRAAPARPDERRAFPPFDADLRGKGPHAMRPHVDGVVQDRSPIANLIDKRPELARHLGVVDERSSAVLVIDEP